MIPLLAVIRISTKRDSRRAKPRKRPLPGWLGLWIPLFLVWLLLLPLLLVLLPVAMLACLTVRVNPFRALAVFWRILSGLSGTRVEVNAPDALVLVRIF